MLRSSDELYDVIVVGAGPAGSSCATMLAKHGSRVLLLDKAQFPREKICGDCINPKCWPIFELLGVAAILKEHNLHRLDSFCVTNRAGVVLRGPVGCDERFPFFSIQRSVLDVLLLENAVRSGVTVHQRMKVIDVQTNGGKSVVIHASGDSGVFEFAANVLVGADGRNSGIAKKLFRKAEIPRRARRATESLYKKKRVGVQWHTHHQPQAGSAIELFLFESGYCGIVNVDDRIANVAMITTPQHVQLGRQNVSRFLQDTIYSNQKARERFPSLIPMGAFSTAFPVHPQFRKRSFPRVFFVGDARQTVEPFTGEGVFFAMQEGVLTAQRILNVHSHAVSLFPGSDRRPFWTNRFSSPLLSHQGAADALISFASRFPSFIPLVVREIMQ